jgi:hypothetical protein
VEGEEDGEPEEGPSRLWEAFRPADHAVVKEARNQQRQRVSRLWTLKRSKVRDARNHGGEQH